MARQPTASCRWVTWEGMSRDYVSMISWCALQTRQMRRLSPAHRYLLNAEQPKRSMAAECPSHSQLLQSCWTFNPPAAGGCRTPAPNCPDKQLQLRINQHGKSHLQQACGKHQLAIVLGQQLLLRGLLQPADDLPKLAKQCGH